VGNYQQPTRKVTKKLTEVGVGSEFRISKLKHMRSRSMMQVRPVSLKENLLKDYGKYINRHLKKLETETDLTTFLIRHDIAQDYRAKMIDWMMEVLATFKMSE
jgi:hypothetical protein